MLGVDDAVDSELCGRTLTAPAALLGDFQVDCSGLNSADSFGRTRATSLLPTFTEEFTYGVATCALYMREPLTPEQQPMGLNPGNLFGSDAFATLTVLRDGSRWAALDGCMVSDEYEETTPSSPGKGRGRYEILAQELAAGSLNATGRYAFVHGEVDWCEYGNRDDCPVQYSSGLTKQVSISAPGGFVAFKLTDAFENVRAEASACRALIDRQSQALRVDLELGTFQGVPVPQYGANCFGDGQQKPPLRNWFEFEIGGVSGPGSYGPYNRCELGASGFRWEVPRSWEGRMDSNSCLQGYLSDHSWVVPTDDSVCSFELRESPGQFSIQCSDTRWTTRGPAPGQPVLGDFDLTADCDVEYVN